MPNVDRRTSDGCVILPFHPPSHPKTASKSTLETTSLAALIAVTVLHETGVNAEDKLMEIIERSGEIEILDADEAYADLGLEEMDVKTGKNAPSVANDNIMFKTV